jgi:hypothetical protein
VERPAKALPRAEKTFKSGGTIKIDIQPVKAWP